MSDGDIKLDEDGYVMLDEAGEVQLDNDADDDCCNCDCECPECDDAEVNDDYPCLPCSIKVTLKGLCRCFCWCLKPGGLYQAYFDADGVRFQIGDEWETWLDEACAVATPAGPCRYEFSFGHKYLALYAYDEVGGRFSCGCESQWYFDSGVPGCITQLTSSLYAAGLLYSIPDPLPSAFMLVKGYVEFRGGGGGVPIAYISIVGEIFTGVSFANIGLPYGGCPLGSVDYSGPTFLGDPRYVELFVADNVEVPAGWVDANGDIQSTFEIDNSDNPCGDVLGACTSARAANGGKAFLSNECAPAERAIYTPDACDEYVQNCPEPPPTCCKAPSRPVGDPDRFICCFEDSPVITVEFEIFGDNAASICRCFPLSKTYNVPLSTTKLLVLPVHNGRPSLRRATTR